MTPLDVARLLTAVLGSPQTQEIYDYLILRRLDAQSVGTLVVR
jgi:hypothetical protein